MNRGAGRRNVFATDEDRHAFSLELATIDHRFEVETHAYCLMDNHFHLLVLSDRGEVSRAMQHLGAVFTRRVNERRGVDGPLFRGRFHSVLLTAQEHFLQLVRYIHRNPLDVRPPPSLDRYPWSSHGAYLGAVPAPPWLHQEVVLDHFGGDVERYRTFVEHEDVDEPDVSGMVATVEPLGIEQRPDSGSRAPTPADVVEIAARLAGISPDRLRRGGRGRRNDARLVAVLVASRVTHFEQADRADAFGFASASGVRSALARARELVRDEASLDALADGVTREARALENGRSGCAA
jgi:REP element-mobilizing transposase RayT